MSRVPRKPRMTGWALCSKRAGGFLRISGPAPINKPTSSGGKAMDFDSRWDGKGMDFVSGGPASSLGSLRRLSERRTTAMDSLALRPSVPKGISGRCSGTSTGWSGSQSGQSDAGSFDSDANSASSGSRCRSSSSESSGSPRTRKASPPGLSGAGFSTGVSPAGASAAAAALSAGAPSGATPPALWRGPIDREICWLPLMTFLLLN